MVLVGSATVPGSRYGALNQDYVLTDVMYSEAELRHLNLPQCFIALVLDGHGMLGEVCAQEAADEMLRLLKASKLKTNSLASLGTKEVEKILVDTFHAGHDAAMKPYDQPPRTYLYPKQAPEERRYTLTKHYSGHTCYSHPLGGPRLLEFGTTATAVLVQGRTLAVAHAGDSLVVVGRENGTDAYSGEYVTERHSGSHHGERERLENYAGKKVKIRMNDGYISVPCPNGPIGTFSLAMTRALGHKMMSDYGVIPTPTVTVRSLGPKDVCIIAASDGVWEGLDPEQAVREVCDSMAQGRDAYSAAQALCTDAVRQVMAVDKRVRADNTTAALIIFDEVIGDEEDFSYAGGGGGDIDNGVYSAEVEVEGGGSVGVGGGGGSKRKYKSPGGSNENGNGNSSKQAALDINGEMSDPEDFIDTDEMS
jgi:serine/threonine protein phosphatase PrpC